MSLNGLSENIFLLEKITKVPEIAHENPLPAQFHRSQGPRALRLEHEQSIVSALSFLSSYTDDGNKVSALCIEETPDRRGLVVSIAANSGELEKLKAGLEGFASILMNEATDARCENNADKLLHEIVDFNRCRLLCRLRSTHSSSSKPGWKQKQPIVNSLAEALRKLQVLQAVPIKTIHGLELITQDLVALFGELERMDRTQALSQEVDRCLLSILRISSQLNTEYRLDDILDTIPQGDNSFPDSRKTSMVEGFRKLSLYVTLSPGLLRFARKLPVFQDILVRAVEVRPTLPNGLRKGSAGTVPEGLLRQHISHRTPARNKTIKRFEHRLGASLADVQADLRKKSLGSKRIHAEIQLLFYYEQQPEIQLRPRVICASKNACYLCNLFLNLHGRFYTPKTHGKLYPQWTLPDVAALSVPSNRLRELEELYRRFDAGIQQKIISCLGTASLAQSFDNESRILDFRSLTASEASTLQGPTDDPAPENAWILSRNTSKYNVDATKTSQVTPMATFGLKRSSVTSSSATQQSIHEQASHQSSFSSTSPAQDLAQPPIPLTSENLGAPSPVPRPTVHTKVEPIQLVPGHPVRSLISTISPPTRFHTSRIHVELSYDQALSIASTDDLLQQDSDEVEAKAEVQVCAEWLSGEETEIINDRPGEVDLAAAWTCKRLDGALLNSDGLLLRKGKDLLKLSVEAS